MARGRGGVNPQDPLEDTTSEDSGSPTKVEDVDVLQQNGKKNKRKEKGKNAANSNNKKYANKSTINANGSSGAAPTSKRRRKRNRVAHLASIEDEGYAGSSTAAPAIPLPINQYKTTLYRRAIRKRESDSQPPSPSSQKQQQPKKTSEEDDEWSDEEAFEEYGDISLGMKLSVIGGRVIVQNLNSLADGRASPAQISGVIQRGDVLLSIDNLSLVNLPIDLLMERLKPLSTPDSATGAYWRVLHLRFSAGEGLPLLRKYEAAEKRKTNVTQSEEAANEVFSLFPMVDNLSGMPLFDSTTTTAIHSPMPKSQNRQHQEEKKQSDGDVDTPESFKTKELHSSKQQDQQMQIQPLKSSPPTTLVAHHNSTIMDQKSLNEIISNDLAYWRSFDRDKFVSEFFAWNEHYSELLRPNSNFVTAVKEMSAETLTRAEMIELGRKALLGAELLSRNMESIDRGRDNRSFRSWNSSISLRSRASTRRRYVLDAASLPVKFDPNSPLAGSTQQQREGASLATTDEESDDELDEVDGDALLLRLAAHDEIWRNQVIEALEKARDDLNKELEEISEKDEDEEEDTVAQIKAKKDNMDSALTEGLGAFLFGDTMAKIVTKKKKTKALPPEEITAVLFDLSTNLATSMPDEITVSAGTTTGLLKASLVPFAGQKQPRTGSSVILATRFVLNEALVIWLETFRPLPWESRRVLWPHVKRSPTGDESRSAHFSDADSLTCDSPRSAYTSNAAGTGAKKDLRQQIEDQELDLETRAETCFLVTYYFTQRLLPRCAAGDRSYETKTDQAGSQSPEEYNGELVEFVRKYGAYMKLHTCLAYAAALECVDSINELLKLAEHDIRHREVVRLFAKRNALILYEPTMLSAIVKYLPLIREEHIMERRQMLVDVCVSAYPDLCPWQVKQALIEFTPAEGSVVPKGLKDELKDLYYYYLSSLLHPQDGHEAARHDKSLVEEWCILSLEGKREESSKRNNFFSVASRNSSNHLAYVRDLVMLIRLSMDSCEYDLALELAGEFLDHSKYTQDDQVLSLVLQCLRDIAHHALDNFHQDTRQHAMLHTLKRAVHLFHYMANKSSDKARKNIDVPTELHSLLGYKAGSSAASSSDVLELINFFAKEAAPSDFLQAFSKWTSDHEMLSDSIHVLQTVLRKGARFALNTELSGSLLRLRRARRHHLDNSIRHVPESHNKHEPSEHGPGEQTLWSMMSKGLVVIDK